MTELLSKQHHMAVVAMDDGDCSHHYCSGHSHREFTCSCGFKSQMPDSYWPDKRPSFGPAEAHLQQVVLAHLGIETSITGRY